MHLHHQEMIMEIAIVLLLITSLAVATPIGSPLTANESHAISNFNATSIDQRGEASSFSPRASAVPGGDGNHIIVFLEPGVKFETCAPNKADKAMCTLAYVERSTWGGWGGVWVYDNECNWLGENNHVARNWLANRWSFASKLPWFVDIKITNAWEVKDREGVEIWYGAHYTAPFYIPMYPHSAFCHRETLLTREPPALYAAFRAPFRCD